MTTMVTRTSIMVKPSMRYLRRTIVVPCRCRLRQAMPDAWPAARVDDHAAGHDLRIRAHVDHVSHGAGRREPASAAIRNGAGRRYIVHPGRGRTHGLQHGSADLHGPSVLPVAAGRNDVDGSVALDRLAPRINHGVVDVDRGRLQPRVEDEIRQAWNREGSD